MKIPKNDVDRAMMYAQLSNDCLKSRDDRISEYIARESYYLFGSPSGSPPANHNKIYPSIQTLASFLYAAETTNFTLEMAANAMNTDLVRVPVVSKFINNTWLGSDSDACAAQCVEWSLVYGCMIMKTMWLDGNFRSYVVRPHDFGVYEEDKTSIDDQDAMVHCYYITKAALERRLEGHPKRQQILDGVSMIGKAEDKPKSGLDRLILTASSPITPSNPNMTGALSSTAMITPPNYDAVLQQDLVEMRELWVWNDEEYDYQIVTQASDITIFDRLCGTLTKQGQMFPKGENPFTAFVPTPKYNYFWGVSDVGRVQNLQDLFTKRMGEFDDLLAKQVNPPRHAIGFTEEQILALSFVGGKANTQDPTSMVKMMPPEIPPQLLNSIEMIEDGFAESLALHNILQGKGEPGVRGRGHAQELARLSSARIKRKALCIEDSLEKVGTLMLKILKLNDATVLPDESTNAVFVLDNFNADCTVKVDAHSNSPLFAEDLKNLAGELLEAQIIDGESFIDLVKPPMADLLKMKLRLKMQQEQAQNQQQQQQGAQGG